jgi:pyruvate formate lyase activating enzyme
MVIGGFQKFSLSDFPGLISAIVFTRGCGFRCPYCHNPELVDPSRYAQAIPLDVIMDFLRSRKGQLQGVVVTGGEPTYHADLPVFLAALKDMGFAIKLDTNGTNPRMLRRLVESGIVDYIAMDIKAPLALYAATVRRSLSEADLLLSIELIRLSGLPHEFRTTFVESLLSADDILEIAMLVKGCQRYVLQSFRSGKVLEAGLVTNESANRTRLAEIARILTAAGYAAEVR